MAMPAIQNDCIKSREIPKALKPFLLLNSLRLTQKKLKSMHKIQKMLPSPSPSSEKAGNTIQPAAPEYKFCEM
jgi:hypothetical protein